MIGRCIAPYYEYPGFFKYNFRKTGCSELFSSVLKPLKTNGVNSFQYLGRVEPQRLNSKDLEKPYVNLMALPFVRKFKPDIVDEEGILLTKYMLSCKYPLAEFTSMARFANDYGTPLEQPWSQAKMMVAEALNFMERSPTLDTASAFQWLERQTSPGYPWTLRYQTKASILDEEWSKSWYQVWENSILMGRARPFLWRCFIKDEIKKKEEILAHNPRTILASPWQATVLGFKMYGVQNQRMTLAGSLMQSPCAVGINKFNRGWHTLAMYLFELPYHAHGDCTRFDGTVSPYAFDIVAELRSSWSAIDIEVLNKYFYDNIKEAWIVSCEGDLFKKFMGQNSGQTNTLHDNSIIHLQYWFYHWCYFVCRDPRFTPDWACFKKHVHLVVMGDDVIWSYSEEVKELMDPISVKNTFLELKVILKAEEAKDYTELEFCSMHFKRHGDTYVPLMKKEKMYASMLVKKNDNPRCYLRRLLAIRIEVWWDLELREFVDNLIQYILDTYERVLEQNPTGTGGDDATLKQILVLRWPKLVIEEHYLKAFS